VYKDHGWNKTEWDTHVAEINENLLVGKGIKVEEISILVHSHKQIGEKLIVLDGGEIRNEIVVSKALLRNTSQHYRVDQDMWTP